VKEVEEDLEAEKNKEVEERIETYEWDTFLHLLHFLNLLYVPWSSLWPRRISHLQPN
jgi:hypothetical protein